MRNIKKIRQLFGVIEAEQVGHSSDHEHFEGDRVVFSELLVKNGEKPEKFLRPHGMPSDVCSFAFSSRVFPGASKIKASHNLRNCQTRRSSRATVWRRPMRVASQALGTAP